MRSDRAAGCLKQNTGSRQAHDTGSHRGTMYSQNVSVFTSFAELRVCVCHAPNLGAVPTSEISAPTLVASAHAALHTRDREDAEWDC
eukprot:2679572-Prymnesium_polylepis.1